MCGYYDLFVKMWPYQKDRTDKGEWPRLMVTIHLGLKK